MLFAAIPATAAVLSWLMLGQRPDIGVGIGLLAGGLACWLNSRRSGRRRAAKEDPGPVPAASRRLEEAAVR
jgi:drug/metabolite transporter (DMT)-like permease